MKKSNKNIIIFSFILATLALSVVVGSRGKTFINRKLVSKEKTKKTFTEVDVDAVNNNNIIYINIDGFSYETYEMANKNPLTETTNINELKKQGVFFTDARTGIPSITDSMQQSIASGAWPIDTGNCYRYYDLEKDQVIQYSRENELENIAQSANENDVDLLAINSWYFKENGSNEEERNLYIESSKGDGYKGRFEILKDVLKGEEIEAYGKRIKYNEPPQFISIYLDDIDGVWHNLSDKMSDNGKIKLETRAEVKSKAIETLKDIDTEIGKVMDILKERGLFLTTSFVITTDHGMVSFGADTEEESKDKDYAYSQMPDLMDTINKVSKKHMGKDFKLEMVNDEDKKASPDADAILTTAGLQVQVKFRKEPRDELLRDIVEALKDKPYYGDHMYQDQLQVRGVPPRFADLLISPKQPYHFSHDFKRAYYAVNQHDSLDEDAQKIFTLVSGPTVKGDLYYDEEIYNIDIAPTMARILGFEGPKSATGTALDDVLIDEYKGPKLEVLDFPESTKIVLEDSIKILIETESESDININRESAGKSDEDGKFEIKEELKDGVNRFIIEVVKDGKSTRKVVFVIKMTSLD